MPLYKPTMFKRKRAPGSRFSALSRFSKRRRTSSYVAPTRSYSAGRRRLARTGGTIGQEVKYLDACASHINIVAPTDCAGAEIQPETGPTDCLSCPARGDGPDERDGQKITFKSIYVEGSITLATHTGVASVHPSPVIFVALVLDTQTNGTAINSEDVFTTINDTASVNCYPLRNMGNTSRFRVLASKTIYCGPLWTSQDSASTCTQGGPVRQFRLSYKRPMVMNFTGTTAAVANCRDNAISLIAMSTSTSMTPNISFNSRMRFVG